MKKDIEKSPVLSSALFLYMLIIILLMTLMPFNFRIPDKFVLFMKIEIWDFIKNIFLFIPIGFLHRLSGKRNLSPSCLKELLMGIVLSSLIEFLQLFLPDRYSSLADILSNGIGAFAGGWICMIISRRLNEKNVLKLFTLELPLMSIIYLLSPLLCFNGLLNSTVNSRLPSLFLLGIFLSRIFASLYMNRLAYSTNLGGTTVSIAAAAWFTFFSFPTLLKFPLHVAGIALLVFLSVIIQIRFNRVPSDSRFEVATIKSALPFYIVYLFLLMRWTHFLKFPEWKLPIAFHYLRVPSGLMELSFVEFLAAFTLMGYITAMIHTRSQSPLPSAACWATGIPLVVTFFTILQRGTLPSVLSAAFPFLAGTVFSLAGVLIYNLQIAAIKRA